MRVSILRSRLCGGRLVRFFFLCISTKEGRKDFSRQIEIRVFASIETPYTMQDLEPL
jgi:hypothetical protein